ncbi:hypothetical protein JCM10450v2_002963 [Rhodotorula kratochvilovae]
MSSSDSGSRYLFPTGRRIVVTVPSWARNLPPDELSDEEDDPAHHDPVPSRPSGSTQRLASVARSDPPGSNPSSARPSHPSSPAARSGSDPGDSAPPQGDGTTPTVPLIRHLSSSSRASSSAHHAIDVGPAPPEQAHSPAALQRAGAGGAAADKGWWTFTLPGKYLDRVHGYIHPVELNEKGKEREHEREHERDGREGADDDSDRRSTRSFRSYRSRLSRRSSRIEEGHDLEKQDYHRKMRHNMHLRLAPPNVFSINQTTTPGWSTPWTPFRREEDPRNFQDPFDLSQSAAQQSKRSRFEFFILQNPFSPLFIRTINLVLIGCTLGLAAHIRVQEVKNNVLGVVGTSTLFAIVVAPFAIVHIFVTLYIEYFGLPIGLWQIHTKMFHTLTELIFICLYSAILSLAFDDLFTSSLQCTSYTPYARYNAAPDVTQTANVEGSLADSICSQQIAQVVFIFCSVVFYVVVLVISLFRIFAKVSKRNGRNA